MIVGVIVWSPMMTEVGTRGSTSNHANRLTFRLTANAGNLQEFRPLTSGSTWSARWPSRDEAVSLLQNQVMPR